MSSKPCKYGCGKTIIYLGKTDKPGSTGMFEVEKGTITKIEHTYALCERILKGFDEIEKKKQEHGGGLDSFNTI